MATLGGSSALHAQLFHPQFGVNEKISFESTVESLNSLSIGTLPADVNTVITNLQGYKTSEETKKAGLVSDETAARGLVADTSKKISDKDAEITAKQDAIDAKAAQITSLITANPLDPQIAAEQANLDTLRTEKVVLQGEKTTFEGDLGKQNADLTVASNKVLDSTIKIALYDQVLAPTTGTVDQAKAAAAAVAADVAKARDQFASGGSGANANATGTQGLQSVIDKLNTVSAGDPAPVVAALKAADSKFQITGADKASIADIQALVGEIKTQLPSLPPISVADRDAAVTAVLNGSYERNAIDTIQSTGIAGIVHRDPATGAVHIGENSLITNEVGGVQELYAQDGAAKPININVTNGSDLLVNGVSVATDADVAAEAATRAAADTVLDGKISDETTRATAAEGVLTTNLNKEVADRIAAVTAEAATRADADTVLDGKISAETTRATAAEGVLTTNLNKEVADRIAAVTAEAATRAAADTTLQANIDSEIAARIADVNAEETRARAAETALAGRATALEGRATALEGRTTALEGRVGRAEGRINSLRKGVSMAAALQTPVIEAGKQNAVKAGVATVDGAQGFGIAVARRINDSVQVNLDVATDFETDTAARAGVNYSF
jgi:hypothetical protein